MEENIKVQKKKKNPVRLFLFAIVIPLVIIAVLAVVVMGVFGFDVIDWAKEKGDNIPVVSELVTTEEEKAEAMDEQQVQAALDSKDNEIIQLNRTITDLEATINSMEQEILKLENNLQSAEAEEEPTEENTEKQGVGIVTDSYEEMKSKQAALILQNMEMETAVLILQEISYEARGDILEAMDPENAATFTQLLIADEN
ncbi:MotE family protein [Oceanobacillus damuensis]|uniref:MotE family protein n=1 Tax=Oceanobacillus damuensis TaxID=937928 RepID=UPI0008302AE0|nr:hypothetical protein [Oceanobacillus damuensis]